jgi:hypothetical protein
VYPDSLNLHPDPAFQVNPDSVPEPGFDDQKMKNNEKKDFFFKSKFQFSYPWAFLKDVQATREAFSPQKKHPSTSKHEIYQHCSIFVGHFCPPASGSGFTKLLTSCTTSTSTPMIS